MMKTKFLLFGVLTVTAMLAAFWLHASKTAGPKSSSLGLSLEASQTGRLSCSLLQSESRQGQ